MRILVLVNGCIIAVQSIFFLNLNEKKLCCLVSFTIGVYKKLVLRNKKYAYASTAQEQKENQTVTKISYPILHNYLNCSEQPKIGPI